MLKLNQNLPRREQPSWLADISHNRILPNKIPLSSILKESCFYPASGTDLTPIEIIAGNVYSFIYCDYSLSKSDVITFFVQKITGLNLIQERFLKENEIERDFWDADHIYDFDEFNRYDEYDQGEDYGKDNPENPDSRKGNYFQSSEDNNKEDDMSW